MNRCQTCWTVKYLLILAVRTVAEGHRMVAQGWAMFEEAVKGAGKGDLPQLLRHLRGGDNTNAATTTTSTSTNGCSTGAKHHIKTIASEGEQGGSACCSNGGGYIFMGLPPV